MYIDFFSRYFDTSNMKLLYAEICFFSVFMAKIMFKKNDIQIIYLQRYFSIIRPYGLVYIIKSCLSGKKEKQF